MQRDFKLAVSVMAVLLLYRVFLIFYYQSDFQDQTATAEFVIAILNGMRYDAVVAGYITVFPFINSLAALFLPLDTSRGRLRRCFMWFFTITASVLLVAHFLYYMEYRENFSHLALTIIYDDAAAVVKTAWRQYPMGKGVLLAVVSGVLYAVLVRRWIRRPVFDGPPSHGGGRYLPLIKVLLILVAFVVMIRGSFGPRPVEPKDGAVTSDQQLNNHVVNPYMALLYAVEGHIRIRSVKGIDTYLRGDSIGAAARRYFKTSSVNNLDAMMARRAPGVAEAPRHIFLIVMESMDAWSLLEKYDSFRLLPNMEKLGREGALFKKFLPAASGTMTSLAAIITGLPDTGVVTNYQRSSKTPYPTSIAPIFKRLGYRTRFFYGGYLSWQRIHDFCSDQGFDDIYGGGHMGKWKLKEWGVDDHVLFDFVKETLRDPRPSFNIILSTTYHSPYDIDVYQWGFPYPAFPDDIDGRQSTDPVEVFGHLWYTDKVVGDFLRSMHRSDLSTLFAVTGDHRSHNYLSPVRTEYERVAVPLLLFGNGVRLTSRQCDQIAGSHMDIGPTLIDLSAPPGFGYHSLGSNLLDLQREQYGFGQGRVITPSRIASMKGSVELLPLPGAARSGINGDSLDGLIQRLRDYHAIGWWRIMRGSDLP